MPSSRRRIHVLCNGVFDIFHYGHLRHLMAAHGMGDWLSVSVTNDAFVNKGPGRPIFPITERIALIKQLKCVDDVIAVDSALQALEITKPDIFCKGKDYDGKIQAVHEQYCKAHGIEIRFTDEPIYSATKIINDRLGKG